MLQNESALGTYRFSWTGSDGVRCGILWGDGMPLPLASRHGFPADVRNPGRFGFDFASARKGGRAGIRHFKAFAQAFADEFDAGVAEDMAEAREAEASEE